MKLAGVTANEFLKTGVMALLFIVCFKVVAEKTNLPGLKSIARAA